MKTKTLLIATILVCSGCSGFHMTAGTGDGIRQYHRGINGALEISKRKSGEKLQSDRGYWATEMEAIRGWAKSVMPEGWQSEEQGS